MSKHTPGPWRIVRDANKRPIGINAPKDRGKRGAVGCVVRDRGIGLPSSPVAEANAHLIAAAPDLLDACKAARLAMGKIPFATTPEAPHWQEPMLAACSACDSAIAKAEGGAA